MLESLNAYKVVMVAINLIILYIVLRKILFVPVTQFMENRTKSIKDSIDNAENMKAEAEALKMEYEKQLRSARETGESIIDEARAKAGREADSIVASARQQAENVLNKAMEDIDRERELMYKEVRSQIAGIALAAASKVIEANMDTEANKALVDRFIDEAGAA